ncbi:MAG: type II toxin-antitoxin system RelE/ParE family toxin [Gammaproteobacteria bacterium]|nr:type II toxin-antitoxin system RelE/ParE family toxin [Gammaproteobacteria bacterium]NNM00069.1 type II toxin-antitoxin system RelE/ParE family toxin [Gammaproteobacteria bacterium]
MYRVIDRIAGSPHQFPKVKGDIRRCFVRRFPFSVLYRIVDDKTVRVLVIRHHRQNPDFGLERGREQGGARE